LGPDESATQNADKEPFISRKSAQDEPRNSPSSTTTISYTQPSTFAQAVAMAPRRAHRGFRGGRKHTRAGDDGSASDAPDPTSSTPGSKYTTLKPRSLKKKTKKWSKLDLNAIDSETEFSAPPDPSSSTEFPSLPSFSHTASLTPSEVASPTKSTASGVLLSSTPALLIADPAKSGVALPLEATYSEAAPPTKSTASEVALPSTAADLYTTTTSISDSYSVAQGLLQVEEDLSEPRHIDKVEGPNGFNTEARTSNTEKLLAFIKTTRQQEQRLDGCSFEYRLHSDIGRTATQFDSFDLDPTPTQATFNFPQAPLPLVASDRTPTQAYFNQSQSGRSFVNPSHTHRRQHSLVHQEDTDSTKGKLEDIMNRIDDVFDVEEWDADPATAAPDSSPEPLTAKAEPLSYTTVGSVIKSNAAPQFTAPIRIQREGAGRRPPPVPTNSRGQDSFYGVRGTPSQFGMTYPPPLLSPQLSQYTPQHQQSQSQQQRQALLSPRDMDEVDREALLSKLGVSGPVARPGNIAETYRSQGLKSDPFIGDSRPSSSYFQNLTRRENISPALSINSTFPGMDRMQTQLRLSQFPNPTQQVARDRLAEFALQRQPPIQPSTAPVPDQPSISANQRFFHGPEGRSMDEELDSESQENGQLDYGFRFPPPGLGQPSNPMSRPLNLVSQTSYSSGIQSEQISPARQHRILSGRPEPLTAGPPGRRQTAGGTTMPTLSSVRIMPGDVSQPTGQPSATQPLNSPWAPYNRQNMFSSIPNRSSEIRDSLSMAEAAKYYPNGFPLDMTGERFPPTINLQQNNLGPIGPPSKADREAALEVKRKEQEKWWYSGVRRIHKTSNDHIVDLRDYSAQFSCGYEPQPCSPPSSLSSHQKLTVDEVNKMSMPDVTAPLLDNVFGTLLQYRDEIMTPDNRRIMSNFEPAKPWMIDNSRDGNVSVFGEDTGRLPKRIGRDPRYEPYKE
jgi:hypothetical protein